MAASGSVALPVAEFHVYCGRSNHPPLPEVSVAFQYEMFTVHEPVEDWVATPPDTEDTQEIEAWLRVTLTTPLSLVKSAPGNSRTVSVELALAPDDAECGVAVDAVALTQAETLTTAT